MFKDKDVLIGHKNGKIVLITLEDKGRMFGLVINKQNIGFIMKPQMSLIGIAQVALYGNFIDSTKLEPYEGVL
jgi:hypothetical protein